ncbi:hypothetical protein BC829DRAFT_399687 [Chytridium lagenaria]|nr:hypothetical protein BC829DRAFT_399687 [Chytridium lagenaria]
MLISFISLFRNVQRSILVAGFHYTLFSHFLCCCATFSQGRHLADITASTGSLGYTVNKIILKCLVFFDMHGRIHWNKRSYQWNHSKTTHYSNIASTNIFINRICLASPETRAFVWCFHNVNFI